MTGNVLADTACPPYRLWVLLATLLASCSPIAWSQTQLATVLGTISDPSAAVIPGAKITIVSQRTGLKRTVLTDLTGQYRLAGLPAGTYAFRIEKPGFQTQVGKELHLLRPPKA